jgi:sigma-54-interacting transcriptional regulator
MKEGAMAQWTYTDFGALHQVCLHRVNALLIGAAPKLDALLTKIRSFAVPPTAVCTLPGPLALPDTGSVLLRDVAALTGHQQQALLEWMNERRPRVQVISVSTERLFAKVKAGLFNDRLYYRLNLLLVSV